MNLLYLLYRLLLVKIVNKMAGTKEISTKIQRGCLLAQLLENLSDPSEKGEFLFYLNSRDMVCLKRYNKYMATCDEDGCVCILSLTVEDEQVQTQRGHIIYPFLKVVELLGFDMHGLSPNQLELFSNIQNLLMKLRKMSAEMTAKQHSFELYNMYINAFEFMHRVVFEAEFVLTSSQIGELREFLSTSEINPDKFFTDDSILMPNSFKFQCMHIEAIDLDEDCEYLSADKWVIIRKFWTIIHKQLSSKEQPPQDLIPFLKQVLPHLKQTENFVCERELSNAMYGVLVNVFSKLDESSDAEIPHDLDDLLKFMQEWVTTMVFPESSELPSMRESLVERLAGIGLDGWKTLCFNKSFERMSPEEKALIKRASALFQAPENSPNFRGPNIWDLGQPDQMAVSFYLKTKEKCSREASGMYASCVSPPLVPEMLLKLLMFLGFPSGLLNQADLPGTITAVMIHFHEPVRSPETREKMREVCNARFIYGVLEHLQISENCVIDRINKNLVTTYLTVTAFFEANV